MNVDKLLTLSETIAKLNEKVDAWGERFKEMEEKSLSIVKELN